MQCFDKLSEALHTGLVCNRGESILKKMLSYVFLLFFKTVRRIMKGLPRLHGLTRLNPE